MSFTSFGEICISFRKSNYFAHVRINMSWIIRCKSNFKKSLYPDFEKQLDIDRAENRHYNEILFM